EDGIRDRNVTGVQTCALPIYASSISEEKGQANYYTVKLDKYDIKAEVTPNQHSAIYRFTYPENADSSLLIDVSRKIGGEVALKRSEERRVGKESMYRWGSDD